MSSRLSQAQDELMSSFALMTAEERELALELFFALSPKCLQKDLKELFEALDEDAANG